MSALVVVVHSRALSDTSARSRLPYRVISDNAVRLAMNTNEQKGSHASTPETSAPS
jgi:hypothetical protein